MKTTNRLRMLATVVVAGILTLAASPAFATSGGGSGLYHCAGGEIPSGTYSAITVTGPCSVAAGAVVTVKGDVTVTKGAALDAQSAPATITIGRNVLGLPGSMVGLGCQPPAYTGNSAHTCTVDPEGHSTIKVGGSITLLQASVVALNGITVNGNVTVLGGGSADIPWSIKNNTIRGNVTVTGQTTNWLGLLFNTIGRNVTLFHIALTDPDPGAPGVYIVRNTIGRNLICSQLTPGVSGGFVPGAVNVVGGRAFGQCTALV